MSDSAEKFNFDFKETVWRRIKTNKPELNKQIKELIESGEVKCLDDFYQTELYGENEADITIKTLVDTYAAMPPEENDGFSTVEVVSGEEIIFKNGE